MKPSETPSRWASAEADRTRTSAPISMRARPPTARTVSAAGRCSVRFPKNRPTSTVNSSRRGDVRTFASMAASATMSPTINTTPSACDSPPRSSSANNSTAAKEMGASRRTVLESTRTGAISAAMARASDTLAMTEPTRFPTAISGSLRTDATLDTISSGRLAPSPPITAPTTVGLIRSAVASRPAPTTNWSPATTSIARPTASPSESATTPQPPWNDKRSAGCRPGFPALLGGSLPCGNLRPDGA